MLGTAFKTGIVAALSLGALVRAADCTRNATIVAGDTCDAISQRYGSSTYQLALANPEVDTACSNLQIDAQICLGLRGSDCTKVYTVVADDTCIKIQDDFGLDDTVLYKNNPQIDDLCSNIYIGEILCVDTKAFAYPEELAKNVPGGIPKPEPSTTSTPAAKPKPTSQSTGLQYCDEGDDSEDCVDEDSIPYCDEI